ncbi:MAG: hypothetical protein NC818_05225 [Candidatus Omnitrophica bacterium]|nr:hypothetical protein [Candidatus Omnitrophota bacterium]
MNRLGYILVETLITVVVLAVGLTLAMNALGSEIHALRISKNYTHASFLLEEKLAEIEKKGEIDIVNEWKEGEVSGGFSGDYENFRWIAKVEVIYDKEGKPTNLVQVAVTVIWREVFRERELTVVTIMPKKITS